MIVDQLYSTLYVVLPYLNWSRLAFSKQRFKTPSRYPKYTTSYETRSVFSKQSNLPHQQLLTIHIDPSVCLSVCPPVRPSVLLSASICLLVCLVMFTMYLCLHLSFCLPFHLPIVNLSIFQDDCTMKFGCTNGSHKQVTVVTISLSFFRSSSSVQSSPMITRVTFITSLAMTITKNNVNHKQKRRSDFRPSNHF